MTEKEGGFSNLSSNQACQVQQSCSLGSCGQADWQHAMQ